MPRETADALRALVARYDPQVFEVGRPHARIRLVVTDGQTQDVLLEGNKATLTPVDERVRPNAILRANMKTWKSIGKDLGSGMNAFRRGSLSVRRDLHLGVGFLAATALTHGDEALTFKRVKTSVGHISICEAGSGSPVVMIHGLGATKASFLPTLAALAPQHRAIAVDLPGFGDSVKPITARYDAAFFAESMVALLDALKLKRADFVGNSMGGRVALELGMSAAERVRSLVLLAPSLAWLKARPWAPYLRLVAPQLGLIQPAPRPVVEAIVRNLIPGSDEEWTAAGIDEFLRSYLTPRGRAAFYAAARNIYLEEPYGPDGFWTRLESLKPRSLFVWGRMDPLVPIRFERHVRECLPHSEHLELSCGHVPQLERPRETHQAILRFLATRASATPRARAARARR